MAPAGASIFSENIQEKVLPRRKSETLTEAELKLMEVLWDKGSATVQEVLEALPGRPALAYNSVLTTIRVLENKGYVQHLKDGRAHVYNPIVKRQDASRSEIRHLVGRFFKDSQELLVINILEDRGIDEEELVHLRQLLQRSKEE
jgi:BlaI family transcriptional regulator, penicillinase repressor